MRKCPFAFTFHMHVLHFVYLTQRNDKTSLKGITEYLYNQKKPKKNILAEDELEVNIRYYK
jgi:hypothetical protein